MNYNEIMQNINNRDGFAINVDKIKSSIELQRRLQNILNANYHIFGGDANKTVEDLKSILEMKGEIFVYLCFPAEPKLLSEIDFQTNDGEKIKVNTVEDYIVKFSNVVYGHDKLYNDIHHYLIDESFKNYKDDYKTHYLIDKSFNLDV